MMDGLKLRSAGGSTAGPRIYLVSGSTGRLRYVEVTLDHVCGLLVCVGVVSSFFSFSFFSEDLHTCNMPLAAYQVRHLLERSCQEFPGKRQTFSKRVQPSQT